MPEHRPGCPATLGQAIPARTLMLARSVLHQQIVGCRVLPQGRVRVHQRRLDGWEDINVTSYGDIEWRHPLGWFPIKTTL